MILKHLFFSAILAVTSTVAAQAGTIDFSDLPSGAQGTSTLVFDNVTITSSRSEFGFSADFQLMRGEFVFFEDGILSFERPFGDVGGICGAPPACSANVVFDFAEPIQNLTFDAVTGRPRPFQMASIFAGTDLLDSFDITGRGTVDFSGFTGITSLEVRSSPRPVGTNGGAGFLLGNFSFDQSPLDVAPVPLPATGFLLMGGLAAVGAIRRRKKAA